MPKNYGYGVKPAKAAKTTGKKSKPAKKRKAIKTVMSTARSY